MIMFVRKKTKLRIAYGLLTFTALATIVRDARLRGALPLANTQGGRIISQGSAVPLAITPLAESPFPEARPNRADAKNALATLRRNSS